MSPNLRVISFVILAPLAIALANPSQNETSNSAGAVTAKPIDPVAVRPPDGMVPDNLIIMGDGQAFSQYAIVADKAKRTLTLWQHKNGVTSLVDAYPMDIGKAGGDKVAEGDHKTPEGIYFPQEMLDGDKVNFELYGVRIFTLDYPNFFDRLAKKTGYGIWLHAVPDTQTLLRGSRGCVVVRNEIVMKLSPYITLKKTPIIIEEEAHYITRDELAARRKAIATWIETWRKSWQEKEIEKYISFYDDQFRSLGMNKDRWKKHKDRLSRRYATISVEITNPVFFARHDEAILNFLQKYDAPGMSDFGRKTLHLRKDASGQYKILSEEWAPEAGGLLAHRPQEAARAAEEKAKKKEL